jgi:hypothetical protein
MLPGLALDAQNLLMDIPAGRFACRFEEAGGGRAIRMGTSGHWRQDPMPREFVTAGFA